MTKEDLLEEVRKLQELQANHQRWFTQEEFCRLKYFRSIQAEMAVNKNFDLSGVMRSGCVHPREKRTYIGRNMLRCGVCGLEFE